MSHIFSLDEVHPSKSLNTGLRQKGYENLAKLFGKKTPMIARVTLGDVAIRNGLDDALQCLIVLPRIKLIPTVLPALKRAVAAAKLPEESGVHKCIADIDKWLECIADVDKWLEFDGIKYYKSAHAVAMKDLASATKVLNDLKYNNSPDVATSVSKAVYRVGCIAFAYAAYSHKVDFFDPFDVNGLVNDMAAAHDAIYAATWWNAAYEYPHSAIIHYKGAAHRREDVDADINSLNPVTAAAQIAYRDSRALQMVDIIRLHPPLH